MNDLDLIGRFLQGRLTEAEAGDVTKRITSDAGFRKLLEREAVLESQLGDRALAHESIAGLSTEDAWGDLAAAPDGSGKSRGDAELTDAEWRRMIAAAVEKAPQHSNVIRFPGRLSIRHLAAAGMILTAGAGIYIWKESARQPMVNIAVPTTTTAPDSASPPRYHDLEVFRIDNANDPVVATNAKPGIVAIAAQTAAVAEQHTIIECSEYRDTAIALDMASGTALFSVEEGKYRFFRVTTPFAEITVTGTIFKVSIDTARCFVSVERGSVAVRQIKKGLTAMVLPGETVEADNDTIVEIRIEHGLTEMVARKKLLADFLAADQSTTPGSAGIVENRFGEVAADTAVERLKVAITNNTPGIDAAVRAYVVGHPTDAGACMLLLDLSRSYESRARWLQAARILEETVDCATVNGGRYMETALYRKGRLYLQAGDTAAAITAFSRFENAFPQSAWQQDIVDLHLSVLWTRGEMEAADTIMLHLAIRPGRQFADRTAMTHADKLREHGQFDRALYWYENIVTQHRDSRFNGDAMYWAGWCVVQQNIVNREKRAFNHK